MDAGYPKATPTEYVENGIQILSKMRDLLKEKDTVDPCDTAELNQQITELIRNSPSNLKLFFYSLIHGTWAPIRSPAFFRRNTGP